MRATINVRLPFERPITLFPCGCRAVIQMPAFVVEWVDPCSKATYANGGRPPSVFGTREHLRQQEWVLKDRQSKVTIHSHLSDTGDCVITHAHDAEGRALLSQPVTHEGLQSAVYREGLAAG